MNYILILDNIFTEFDKLLDIFINNYSEVQPLLSYNINKGDEDMKDIPNEVIELYQNEHKSIKELANQYKVGQGTIKKFLIRNNVQIRDVLFSRSLTPIPVADVDKIRKLYENGDSVRDLAELYKTPKPTMLAYMTRHGIDRRSPAGDPVYDKLLVNKQKIIETYNEQHSITPIASQFSCSESAIKNFMDKENIERKQYNSLKDISNEDIEKIKDMYCNQNISLRQISKKYGVSGWTLTDFLKRNNVEIRQK